MVTFIIRTYLKFKLKKYFKCSNTRITFMHTLSYNITFWNSIYQASPYYNVSIDNEPSSRRRGVQPVTLDATCTPLSSFSALISRGIVCIVAFLRQKLITDPPTKGEYDNKVFLLYVFISCWTGSQSLVRLTLAFYILVITIIH